tara:strand:- start:237 stop:449 length:213 start_codon:yes stop_codon:yes gene_type:complete
MKPGYIIRDKDTAKYGYVLEVQKDFYGTNTAGIFQDRVYVRWFIHAPHTNSLEHDTSYEPSGCLEVISEI